MTNCSRCGRDIGAATSCPHCGGTPSQGVVDRSVGKVANVTGKVLEKGVHVTETVVKETKPVVKEGISLGIKGLKKAKDKTVEVAKDLQKKKE